jgi:hypothetical protein
VDNIFPKTGHLSGSVRRTPAWLALTALMFLNFAGDTEAGDKVNSRTPINVWATGEGIRVNPETSRYFEDRTDIHPDYPTGDYRNHNVVWDASARRVTLHAARNEFVSFQLIVESDQPISGATVRFDSLQGPGRAEITGRNITLFKAWYVHVTEPSSLYERTRLGTGWYPDALLPAKPGSILSFDIPDADNSIGPSQTNQTLWVDIFVPRDRSTTPPGEYHGELQVAWPGGGTAITVELNLWDFELPEQIHLRGDIWNGSLRRMDPDLELRYYQMAHRHRFQPGVCYYRPKLKVTGTDVSVDWTDYDARVGKYLDGSAFTESYGDWGPGYGVPIDHILLPFNAGWPMHAPEGGPTPEYEAVWRETARQVKAHFQSNPTWRQVGKVLFIGSLDESYNQAAYNQMKYYSQLLKPALGEGWYQFRIDGGYNTRAMTFLQPYVDLLVCTVIAFNEVKIPRFRKLGVEPWFYGMMVHEQAVSASGSNTFLDLDLLTCRGVGWAAWKTRAGFCSWEFDAFFDSTNKVYDPEKAWRDAANFRHHSRVFNGSGLLIYRGSAIGRAGPIPSIRLKAHRRGFQDYEYFWLLREAGRGDDADRLVDSIIPRWPFGETNIGNIEIWKNDPEAWDVARIQAGEMLSALPAR